MIEIKELDERYLDVSSIKNKVLDIAYGPHERQKMDVYLPEIINESMPCIIFVHGGGLIKGDKRRYQLKGPLQGLDKGYIIIALNYRLAPNDVYPKPFEDINAAMRYIRTHYKEYHIDISKLIMWGESAGALLSMVTSYCSDARFINTDINTCSNDFSIHTIVNQYGPTSLLEEYKNTPSKRKLREIQFGLMGEELERILHDISPINLVSKYSPNLIVQHGTEDTVVSLEQANSLVQRYQELQIKKLSKLYIYEGFEHNPDHFFNTVDDIFNKLKRIL